MIDTRPYSIIASIKGIIIIVNTTFNELPRHITLKGDKLVCTFSDGDYIMDAEGIMVTVQHKKFQDVVSFFIADGNQIMHSKTYGLEYH